MKILVADDEPVARLLAEATIRQLGHECLGAVDGMQAWELFQTREVDVIISDWQMPFVDGTELCRKVRSCADNRSYTPFMFLTALDDKRHALQAMEAGADDYLVKPLDIDDLRARLMAAQRLKRIEDQRRHLLAEERLARADAESALRTRDDVLAAVSHDLRVPLTVISASAQLLRMRLARLEPGAETALLNRFADRIATAASRMNTWIEDLMDVSRLRVGEPVILHLEVADLVDLVQRAADDHQATTSQHHIVFETHQTSLVGMWDEPRLRRALDNLFTNAIKYSPHGGAITITLDERPALAGSSVVLCMQDAGVGIPASDLGSVFSRYRRAGNVGQIAGQGVGLAGVRQIVEQHGGTVTVESSEGAGSRFTVQLPLVREPPAA